MTAYSKFEMFLKDESGQDMIEYALVAGCIGLGLISSMKGVAAAVGTTFAAVGNTLTTGL